jgi:hypothetical protein
MFDIEFSEFIAIFDVCGVLIFTVFEVKGLNIEYTCWISNSIFIPLKSNIGSVSDIEDSDKLAKFDIQLLKFEYT